MRRSCGLRGSDDEGFASGFDDLAADGREAVDLEDAGDLGEQALDEAEVAACDASDRSDRFGIGE